MSVTPEHMNAAIAASEERVRTITAELRGDMKALSSEVRAVRDDVAGMKQSLGNQKYWLVGTAVATVLGIAAFNATVLSNMIASFESGKSTAAAIEKSASEQAKTAERIDAILQRAERMAQPPTGK